MKCSCNWKAIAWHRGPKWKTECGYRADTAWLGEIPTLCPGCGNTVNARDRNIIDDADIKTYNKHYKS